MLFNGTVFDNIAQGLVGTSWELAAKDEKLRRVQAAARTAFANDFIEALPQGYDTRIGERGGLLSGGQKQRIAIARSIISEPKILLLDEATSALDPHAEKIVQQALDEASKNRTTIVIAHKLKTIRDADNIVVMKQGEIIEQGRHDDLLASDGAYAKLVKAQDLSPKGKLDDNSSGQRSDDENEEVTLKHSESLARRGTALSEERAPLRDHEDYNKYHKTGVVQTVLKLVAITPEIKSWYLLAVVTCIVGGKSLAIRNTYPILTVPHSGRLPWPGTTSWKHHGCFWVGRYARKRELYCSDVFRHGPRARARLWHPRLGNKRHCAGQCSTSCHAALDYLTVVTSRLSAWSFGEICLQQ